jgi:hypothetical protein
MTQNELEGGGREGERKNRGRRRQTNEGGLDTRKNDLEF